MVNIEGSNIGTFTSCSYSVPRLVESNDSDDNSEEEAVVLFFDEDKVEDCGSWETWGEQIMHGRNSAEISQTVTFVRSSKDPETGNFVRERKRMEWCIENGCEEVAPGVWCGSWYFTYLYGEVQGRRAWLDSRHRRIVKDMEGKAIKVDEREFSQIVACKNKGNRAFWRGQYNGALDYYTKAENLIGGDVMGFYLVASQRAELVKVLSNQAECYLRLRKYEEAISKATAALRLDRRHEKSLLRRAKAIAYGAERNRSSFDSLVACKAMDDLRLIIQTNGQGKDEAEILIGVIGVKLAKIGT